MSGRRRAASLPLIQIGRLCLIVASRCAVGFCKDLAALCSCRIKNGQGHRAAMSGRRRAASLPLIQIGRLCLIVASRCAVGFCKDLAALCSCRIKNGQGHRAAMSGRRRAASLPLIQIGRLCLIVASRCAVGFCKDLAALCSCRIKNGQGHRAAMSGRRRAASLPLI